LRHVSQSHRTILKPTLLFTLETKEKPKFRATTISDNYNTKYKQTGERRY